MPTTILAHGPPRGPCQKPSPPTAPTTTPPSSAPSANPVHQNSPLWTQLLIPSQSQQRTFNQCQRLQIFWLTQISSMRI